MSELQDLYESINPIPENLSRCGDGYCQHVYMLIDPYASGYKARFEGFKQGLQHQQSKVDELQVKLNGAEERALTCIKYKDKYLAERNGLQKENAALVHVIKSRDIQLENEKHEYDELMNKLVDSRMKNKELQKRLDAVQALAERWEAYKGLDIKQIGLQNCANELEQALKGDQ